jgi:hypothetical protein
LEYIINIDLDIKRVRERYACKESERELYACKEFYLKTMSNAKINPVFGCGWMEEICLQSNGRIILTGQNSSTERKPCISATFFATNPTRTAL